MRIYVGNLQHEFSEGDVRDLFSSHGQVESVAIIRAHDTGRSKGFAFVEMPVDLQAKAAIEALNGQIFHQPTRTLTVHEARPRQGHNAEDRDHRPSARVDRSKLNNRGRVHRR